MLKHIFLLLFISSSFLCVYGNQDSILLLVEASSDPIEKIKLYEELYELTVDRKLKLKYAEAAYQIAKEEGLDFLEAKSLVNIAAHIFIFDSDQKSIDLLKQALLKTEKLNSDSKKIFVLQSYIYHLLGGFYSRLADYSAAINSYYKTLITVDNIGIDSASFKASIYSDIGFIYENLATYDLAEEYYLKANDEFELNNNSRGQLFAKNNYITVLHKQGRDVEVIAECKNSLNMISTMDSLDFKNSRNLPIAIAESNAYYYLGISHLNLQLNNEARQYLLKAKKIYEEMGQELYIAYCDLFISKLDNDEKYLSENVLNTIQESVNVAIKFKDSELRKLGNELLAEVLRDKGDYKGALEASTIVAQIKDSVDNKELSLKIQSVHMQNEFEREKTKLAEANKLKIYQSEIKGEQNRNKMLWIFLGLLGLSSLLLFNAYKTTAQIKDKLAINNVELLESENQLSIINQDLQKHINLNLELEQFAYIASHDIKAPLRTIHSFGTLLKRSNIENYDEKSKSYLDYILKGAMSLNLLVDDLLEFSKSDTKTLQLTKFTFDSVLEDVIENLDFSISHSNAILEKQHVSGIVHADYVKLKQILQNLISNALKFYSPDRQPVVKVSLSQDDSYYTISIKDNGIGIPEEEFEQVFQKFHRLHSKEKYEGTGLGLSICKKYIEAHQGNISIKKNDDFGITVDFTISKNLSSQKE